MRLIDADAFKKYIDAQEGRTFIGCTVGEALKIMVGEQPTVEERKKGRWLRYGEDGYPNNEDTVFWQCDQCLEQYTGRAKKIPNFCPNCVADMRGGDAE
jgi:rubrerythrin